MASTIQWRLKGEELGSCNCAWGCPCQFNSLPTHGNCEALAAFQIHRGHYGDVSLNGLRMAAVLSWPGAVHEGNGTRRIIIDESASPEQRRALLELWTGKQGGTFFEIFAAVCPNTLEPEFAPISLRMDREKRIGTMRIPGIGESDVEPIKNPITGQEHRARIDLPNGFEYKIAEMANSVHWKATAGPKLELEHRNSYAHFCEVDWSNG